MSRLIKLSDQLRVAVDASPMSRYAICKATGIHEAAMSRFMARKAGLLLDNVDELAGLLKLNLTTGPRRFEPAKAPRRPAKGRRKKGR